MFSKYDLWQALFVYGNEIATKLPVEEIDDFKASFEKGLDKLNLKSGSDSGVMTPAPEEDMQFAMELIQTLPEGYGAMLPALETVYDILKRAVGRLEDETGDSVEMYIEPLKAFLADATEDDVNLNVWVFYSNILVRLIYDIDTVMRAGEGEVIDGEA